MVSNSVTFYRCIVQCGFQNEAATEPTVVCFWKLIAVIVGWSLIVMFYHCIVQCGFQNEAATGPTVVCFVNLQL